MAYTDTRRLAPGGNGPADSGFVDKQQMQRALDELKRDPAADEELARKFMLYESYFEQVTPVGAITI